ncbi:hypothetical protein EQO05_09075 [Methanosarcina sp. MSH10X1]|uniref:hypothetical protein n=1 Tax=Methanosarcina sp. MSH10X1 TaxID=2507075 RepID=UPI000FFC7212|nr:hypothetical protein [Methanosarcina sp. MSH10X1]RXA19490.1 hypothetical protein EQO05_09075 [Methanosarcina sp. MSH10X1]
MQLYLNSVLMHVLVSVYTTLFMGFLKLFSFKLDISLIYGFQAHRANRSILFYEPFLKTVDLQFNRSNSAFSSAKGTLASPD